jgi:glycosyltransferase involved in cell wall biosynthesis
LPIDVDEWRAEPPEPDDGLVTVVHAPNHRHYKGTRFLEAAVDELRREGVPVELVLVEGTPADAARRIYAQADVVADQFLLGAYGFFALEGMALGKPVICHLDERVAAVHPEWAEAPIVSATPDTLVDELRKLVLDAELRAELGRRGAEFVRRHHTFETVGAQMDRISRRAWFARNAPRR